MQSLLQALCQDGDHDVSKKIKLVKESKRKILSWRDVLHKTITNEFHSSTYTRRVD